MSTLSAINNTQRQFTDLAPSSITKNDKTAAGDAFGKTLDLAIKHKAAVLPGPANLAADIGIDILEQKGLMPKAQQPNNIKDSIEGVFDDLSVGIATNFVAALSGQDSATAVTPTAETAQQRAKEGVAAHPDCLAHEKPVDAPIISAENISDTKKMLDGISPLLPDNKVMPIANSALSSLEDVLLDDKDEKEKRKI